MVKYKCKIYWKGAPEAYDVEYSSAEELSHHLCNIASRYSDTPNLCVKITTDTGRLCYDSWLTEPTAIGFKQFLESYEKEEDGFHDLEESMHEIAAKQIDKLDEVDVKVLLCDDAENITDEDIENALNSLGI